MRRQLPDPAGALVFSLELQNCLLPRGCVLVEQSAGRDPGMSSHGAGCEPFGVLISRSCHQVDGTRGTPGGSTITAGRPGRGERRVSMDVPHLEEEEISWNRLGW
jgi:hypothetical protein